MSVTCFFCEEDVENVDSAFRPTRTLYSCRRCGYVHLDQDCASDLEGANFSQNEKRIISITLRIDYERRNRRPKKNGRMTLGALREFVKQYKTLDALAKMDNALINIDKATEFIGENVQINLESDYPYYHCFRKEELRSILLMLHQDGLVNFKDRESFLSEYCYSTISTKGYQRLREINKYGKDSKQCFVAMWFTTEMNDVFDKAIKPAIEFVEPGEITPRYEAIKIDNVDHLNDINDEIIAQIRRSRFMVCDLSGYKGGVYFEAGFAYGLGLEVIYTCNKNWTKEEVLRDHSGSKIAVLLDSKGKEIKVKKEGVHFDLDHRNRIEWDYDDLEGFREKLKNRIRANIF